MLFGQRFSAEAADVVLDELVRIDRSWFRGHVYDLQTTKGSIIAGHSWLAPG